MKGISVGELVKQAKGKDRSLREYARDSGVDAAIISKIINGNYIPKKLGLYEALTSLRAAPRGGVSYQQLIEAAGTSEEYRSGMTAGMSVGVTTTLSEVPSSSLITVLKARGIAVHEDGTAETSNMKLEDIQKAQRLRNEKQRFEATANGIILGSLGKKGLTFQIVQTDGREVDGIRFDTYVRLMNHVISEYLIRYAFISEEEAGFPSLAKNTVRVLAEELIFLKPFEKRKVSIVTNHPDAFEDLCTYKGCLSYNGELSLILFDLDRARLLKETYLSHYISGSPIDEIHLI